MNLVSKTTKISFSPPKVGKYITGRRPTTWYTPSLTLLLPFHPTHILEKLLHDVQTCVVGPFSLVLKFCRSAFQQVDISSDDQTSNVLDLMKMSDSTSKAMYPSAASSYTTHLRVSYI